MAYIHYHEENKKAPVTSDEWSRIQDDFLKLSKALPTVYKPAGASRYQTVKANIADLVVDERMISFMGIDEDGDPLGNRVRLLGVEDDQLTSQIRAAGGVKSTETGRGAHDLVVCALLIVAEKHAPGAWVISSVGTLQDWSPAWGFVTGVLGENYIIPVGVQVNDLRRGNAENRIKELRQARAGAKADLQSIESGLPALEKIFRGQGPSWLHV